MVSGRRAEGTLSPLELEPAKPPSKWPAFVALGALILVVVGLMAWRVLRPDPCRGKNFASDSFGYCLTVPAGWTAGMAQVGNVPVDQFTIPSQSATVLVEAVDLTAGGQLSDFGNLIRQREDQAGLAAGPIHSTIIDGVDAQEWDITVSSQSGDNFVIREVVAVRNEVGWRITMDDSADSFDENAPAFDQMLRSWRFA